MASNEETNAAGTDTRPPMLVESDYESWKIRIHRFIKMVKTGLFKANDSLIPLDEHLATFRGNGYSLKDKNEAKTDKTEHGNGRSVKSQH
ncbi:hypothetical protein Tco_1115943 [Tanacetum coccineum]